MNTLLTLPTPYPGHRHASEQARQIAQEGLVLLVEVGSGVHGTALPGSDDTDQMGVCIEPPEYVTGLRRFEQFERHTAWDRGGVRERSGAGDLDVVVYGIRKFCRLAMDGNPSILTLLFVPNSAVAYEQRVGRELLQHTEWFVSLRAADRYLGYLRSQRSGMRGTGRVNRPELVAKYGFDPKFAAHALRLGIQGVELMTTGQISLPMAPAWRDYLLRVRRGEEPLEDIEDEVEAHEEELDELRRTNPLGLPDGPDRSAIDRWLHRTYLSTWLS